MKIGYARVSTQDQDLALQLDALTKEGCEKIFQEKASGAQLAYMRKGDTLVVWKLDRLARSMKQLIETIESFQDDGIGLKSLRDPIDTSSISGKLVFHIFAALAEFERDVIRERTTAGLRAARERGRVGGRPPALSAHDLQAAKAMLKDSDIAVAAVARRLNVAESTLYRHIPRARSASLEEKAEHDVRMSGSKLEQVSREDI
jgi:DNA invertase Pin-like site-specific DNA recombinase